MGLLLLATLHGAHGGGVLSHGAELLEEFDEEEPEPEPLEWLLELPELLFELEEPELCDPEGRLPVPEELEEEDFDVEEDEDCDEDDDMINAPVKSNVNVNR